MSFIIPFVVKGVATGIGLASEGIHNHNEKKHAKKAGLSGTDREYDHHNDANTIQGEHLREFHEDATHWDLDDAQNELVPVSHGHISTTSSIETQEKKKETRDLVIIIDEFVYKYPTPSYGLESHFAPRIALPVILPQRRPKARARGFVRAYAPVLIECGITEPMFLDFLETFNKAAESSPWLNAINLVGLVGNLLPHGLGVVLCVAIYLTIHTAQEIQGRSRTNTFLHSMNEKFFRPRGLYCLVLTWNPDSASPQSSVDITTNIATSLAPPSFARKWKTSAGNTYGDFEFPEAAPLLFPGLEELSAQSGDVAEGKRQRMKEFKGFAGDYFDRRARAQYAAENPDSLLAQGPKDKFHSRYADPTHPASSGNLISLITGGHINPPPGMIGGGLGPRGGLGGFGGRGALMGRGGYDPAMYGRGATAGFGGRHDAMGGYDPAMYGRGATAGFGGRYDAMGGRGLGGGFGGGFGGLNPLLHGAKKILGKNVLYLMIVNMPTNEEMNAAMNTADKVSTGERYKGPHSGTYHPWTQKAAGNDGGGRELPGYGVAPPSYSPVYGNGMAEEKR